MKVVAYVFRVLVPIAAVIWLVNLIAGPMKASVVESGTSVSAGSSYGGTIIVQADSKVCVNAVSESEGFIINTPDGKIVPTVTIGDSQYFYGSGCFQPGIWTVEQGSVVATLTNPTGVTATSNISPTFKNFMIIFPIVMECLMFVILNVTFFTMERSRKQKTKN